MHRARARYPRNGTDFDQIQPYQAGERFLRSRKEIAIMATAVKTTYRQLREIA